MTELKTKIEYHDNGEKYQEYTVNSEGKTHGLYQKWYSNGQLREEIKYVNGEKDGLDQWWHSNGQKKLEVNYVNGKLISKKEWDKEGDLILKERF